MTSFFISYNKADKVWAEWIAWTLEEAGHNAIIQAWDFRPGGNFVLDMQRAAAETDKTIVILSNDYLNAEFTQPEWAAAFAADPTSLKRKIIPIRVKECNPLGLLRPIAYVDLVKLEANAARQAILQALPERLKPTSEPFFPKIENALTKQIPPEFPSSSASKKRSIPYVLISSLFISGAIISGLSYEFRNKEDNNQISVIADVEEIMEVRFRVFTFDNEPLTQVEVIVISNSNSAPKYTDSNGYVSIQMKARKNIDVILRKEGYQTTKQTLNLGTDSEKTFALYLEKVDDTENTTVRETELKAKGISETRDESTITHSIGSESQDSMRSIDNRSLSESLIAPPSDQTTIQEPEPIQRNTSPPDSELEMHSEFQQVLAIHNQLRSEVNVPPLSWSVELANYAQAWAEHLSRENSFTHSPSNSTRGGTGENLAAGNAVEVMLNLWADEKENYNPSTGKCVPNKLCGHYTQIVWSDTVELGCGISSHRRYGKVMVCNYSPPGNYIGQKPY